MQAVGLVLAVLSLVSYWLVTLPGGRAEARPLLPTGDQPTFTILLAGRDIKYCRPGYAAGGIRAVPCEGENRYDTRTDTVMVARVRDGVVDLVSVPRDTIVLGRYQNGTYWHKVNSSYGHGGADALLHNVESLLGTSIEYFAIVKIEFMERLIDALGGLDVYTPTRMKYDDFAANLHVDIPAGTSHLDGKRAVEYLRLRQGEGVTGNDYGRMDRSKAAVVQLVEKAKSPAIVNALPTLVSGMINDVETNIDIATIQAMLPHLRSLNMRSWTLPTREPGPGERWSELGSYLVVDEAAVRERLNPAVNGEAGNAEGVPDVAVTIVNSSGVDGMARALAAYMVRKGLPEPRVVTGEPTGEPTEVLRQGWSDPAAAEYYGRFLRVPVFTPNIFPALDDPTPIVIRIGSDAATKWAALAQVAASTLASLDAPAPEAR